MTKIAGSRVGFRSVPKCQRSATLFRRLELASVDRFPGRGWTAGGGAVPPHVVVLVSSLTRHRLLEPLVLVGGVARHQVHHNLRQEEHSVADPDL
jgi:hypothetical protein